MLVPVFWVLQDPRLFTALLYVCLLWIFSECCIFFFCRVSDTYSEMSDGELDGIIAEINIAHPNTGYRMMGSFLRARGLRVQSKFEVKSCDYLGYSNKVLFFL